MRKTYYNVKKKFNCGLDEEVRAVLDRERTRTGAVWTELVRRAVLGWYEPGGETRATPTQSRLLDSDGAAPAIAVTATAFARFLGLKTVHPVIAWADDPEANFPTPIPGTEKTDGEPKKQRQWYFNELKAWADGHPTLIATALRRSKAAVAAERAAEQPPEVSELDRLAAALADLAAARAEINELRRGGVVREFPKAPACRYCGAQSGSPGEVRPFCKPHYDQLYEAGLMQVYFGWVKKAQRKNSDTRQADWARAEQAIVAGVAYLRQAGGIPEAVNA